MNVTRLESGPVLTVSQLLLRATNALVAELGSVAVEGEISSFHHAVKSGHMYWTLKDATSEVRCVMFRSDNQQLEFPLVDGTHVVVMARPTIYPSRGQFQLQITQVLPRGRGALHLQFEALRKKLAAEGLFDSERKRSLPFWPQRVGVITSAEGAAVRDIISVIHRRAPATRIVLKPVPVQGREAAPEIARAVEWFSAQSVAEVVIVGRGGGSLEDLWAFNEEVVVRAIAESAIPIVSAVGHESDTTLSDFAADLRAPTPSVAAERVVPETREIEIALERWLKRLAAGMERQRRRRIDEALAPIRRYGFRRVRDRLFETRQHWGDSVGTIVQPVAERRQRAAESLDLGCDRIPSPVRLRLREAATRLDHLDERLKAVSPLAILERGYAVVAAADGAVVRDAAAVSVGDEIGVRLARGALLATVERRLPVPETEIAE